MYVYIYIYIYIYILPHAEVLGRPKLYRLMVRHVRFMLQWVSVISHKYIDKMADAITKNCNISRVTPLDKMASILSDDFSKCIFLNESEIIRIQISLKFVPRVQLTVSRYWFRQWLGAEQATSHFLNQWKPFSPTHICCTRGRWFKLHRPLWLCMCCFMFL